MPGACPLQPEFRCKGTCKLAASSRCICPITSIVSIKAIESIVSAQVPEQLPLKFRKSGSEFPEVKFRKSGKSPEFRGCSPCPA